jgi:hypothetical protein
VVCFDGEISCDWVFWGATRDLGEMIPWYDSRRGGNGRSHGRAG